MNDAPTQAANNDEASALDAAQTLGRMSCHDVEAAFEQLSADEIQRIADTLPGAASTADAQASALSAAAELEQAVVALVSPAPAVLESACTVAEAVSYMVHSQAVADITYIYVVDAARLVGVVGMRDIVLAKPGQLLREIMVTEPFVFGSDMPISTAVREALRRHYPMYPVVDNAGGLLGIVRSWQLFQRVAIEVSGQVGAQVGVSREESVATGWLAAFRLRHPWLLVNLLTAFAAALVVGLFEGTIAKIVALAVFLPVLAGQSGNTGCQAMAITLRGITLGQLTDYPVRRILRKEITLGALNGFVVGFVTALAMWAYATLTGQAHAVALGLVVWVAMTGACIGSGIFGVLVPVTLKRLGADPAMASSIFLTTITDILGMGLMLLLASAILL